MKFLFYALVFIVVGIVLAYLYIFLSGLKNNNWYKNPSSEGKYADSYGKKLFYRVKGRSGATVVVINSIGSSQAEWWTIQNEIGLKNRMITWDRSGYGRSLPTNEASTAKAATEELNLILRFERINKPVILVANYTGILFAMYYAKVYPERVAGLIFVNPFPLRYSDWIEAINDIDECPNPLDIINKNHLKASKGLFRFFSPYKGYKLDRRFTKYIIEHYSKTGNYDTMKEETSMIEEILNEIDQAGEFPKTPLNVLYPASEPLIRDWVRNGINEYSSRQLARVYEDFLKDIINLTSETISQEVEGAGEYIHLSKPNIIVQEINKMITEQKRKL